MKRFVVIITSLLIIFVFVALNYLLWDRESLLNLGESNQASIDALSRINMSLSEEKNRLTDQNAKLTNQVGELEARMKALEEDALEQRDTISNQSEFILALKMQINPLPVKAAAFDWVSLLFEKAYDRAFLKSEENCSYWDNQWNLRAFTNYFDQNFQQIQPKLVGEEQQPVIDVFPSRTPDFEMNVTVHIMVELKENAKDEYLEQGENILKLTYTYNDRIEQWLITSVLSEAVETPDPSPTPEPEPEPEQTEQSEQQEPTHGEENG